MSDIKFTGNRLIKSIAKDFSTKFPYLYLRFFDAKGKQSSWDVTHASIRAKKSAEELATTGIMHVETFKRRYKEAFGVETEIMHVKGGRKYKPSGEDNKLTLNEYNKKVQAAGASNVFEVLPNFK
ncbi:MAG: hypothetical protein ACXITV_12360 [Luteibaculaceae bacterium]